MRTIYSLLGLLALASTLSAAVIHPAPDFTFLGAGSKARSLRSVHGQPVILIIADSPKTKPFVKQLKVLRRGYSQFASRQAIFMVAFRDGSNLVESNIPFVVVNNGEAVAERYGVKENFNVVIVGVDGNLDYQTANIVAPERMIDVIQNGYSVQAGNRKEVER